MVAMAGLLFTLHWSVGLIVVLAAIPGAWVRVRYSRRMYHWQRERTTTERQAWYAHWLLTGGHHAKEVRLFGLGELFRALYRDLRTVLRRSASASPGAAPWPTSPAGAGRRARHLRHLRLHRLADHLRRHHPRLHGHVLPGLPDRA